MNSEFKLMELLEKSPHKVNSLCRTCLDVAVDTSARFSLFNKRDSPTLGESLVLCTKLVLSSDDELPKSICNKCYKALVFADSFRIQCEFSDDLLKKIFQNHCLKEYKETLFDNKDLDPAVKCDLNVPKDEDSSDGNLEEILEEPELDSWDNNGDNDVKENIAEVNIIGGGAPEELKKSKPKSRNTGRLKKKELEQKETANSVVKLNNTATNPPDNPNHKQAGGCGGGILAAEAPGEAKRKAKAARKIPCPHCKKKLTSQNSLENHLLKLHRNEDIAFPGTVSGWGAGRTFHCVTCEYSTPHSQSLVYHVKRHTGEKPYECETCGKKFAQPSSLNCHKRTHSDQTYYTCAECGRQFKYKEAYQTHKSVHNDQPKFVCDICHKGVKTRTAFEGHMNRHRNIRNFSCETCGMGFVTRVELLNHSKKHSPVRNFKCTLCDFETYLKKGLETHIQRHSGIRPFKCEHCEAACYTQGELKCHIRRHTRERIFCCPVCQQGFIHSSSVNKHMLRVHQIRYRRSDTLDRRVVC